MSDSAGVHFIVGELEVDKAEARIGRSGAIVR